MSSLMKQDGLYQHQNSPPVMKALQELGMREPAPTTLPGERELEPMQVQLLSVNGKLPTKATEGSAGYDLYSAEEKTIAPHSRALIQTDITIVPPPGTYGQIASSSGLALKYGIDTRAGVIDSDYRGNIAVLLDNTTDTQFSVKPGDRIAQLLLYYIANPTVEVQQQLTSTERGAGGFGSTGTAGSIIH
jgi:dUTP pyrophosphatase